ncbi:MAG TPA: UvrD-helicase domain-containing protein [Candidatus Paceibacterota bacterium]|nr:UvrD-helicase domain-containing protein [Candidatus Paceibacterota bacterium]
MEQNTFLEGLNDAQRSAVLATDGPVLIVAGAGAGKTKTVVHRICHLIVSGVAPSQILAVTFTNKAAAEMRERVGVMVEKIPGVTRGEALPFVSTFHSFGVFLLRKFGAHNGQLKRFTMLDDADTMALIKESLAYHSIDPKQYEPRAIRSLISKSVCQFLQPSDIANEPNPYYKIAARVWERYEHLKREQKALDFDDLLTHTVLLLEKNKEALDWCHNTWSHIHVDEYQDTNEPQYRIATLLAQASRNLCVVGDSDQSIYSWRGANIKNILEFERDYPDATVILLEENYRSTKTIIQSANEIIAKNKYRKPKNLFTNNQDGESISLYCAYDEADEARFIVERAIEQLDKGVRAEEIAVLYRTNFQSRVLEEAFLNAHIPYHVLGVRFFERKEIKDAVSYLRAALTPESTLDIKRTINTPARGIGKTTLLKVFSGDREALPAKAKAAVAAYYALLDSVRAFAEAHPVSHTLKYIITESGLEKHYQAEPDGEEHLENLRELVTLSLKYDHLPGIAGAEKLIEDATLASDQDSLESKDEKKKGVKLMTIHASKGLEFNVVFVAGLEHGLFPHERDAKQAGPDGEEERRLMYVALTRARQKLFLSYASMRTIFGMRDVRLPSEFLLDIPEELITRETRDGEFTVYL